MPLLLCFNEERRYNDNGSYGDKPSLLHYSILATEQQGCLLVHRFLDPKDPHPDIIEQTAWHLEITGLEVYSRRGRWF